MNLWTILIVVAQLHVGPDTSALVGAVIDEMVVMSAERFADRPIVLDLVATSVALSGVANESALALDAISRRSSVRERLRAGSRSSVIRCERPGLECRITENGMSLSVTEAEQLDGEIRTVVSVRWSNDSGRLEGYDME